MAKTQKDLIKSYVEIKKSLGPHDKLTLDSFVADSGHSKGIIYKLFTNWAHLREQGDESFLKTLSGSQKALLSEHLKKFDPDATKDELIEDLRSLQKANWGKVITRNFYGQHGRYSDSTWNKFFGTFQEFRRQAGLELTRQQHNLERNIAKHASIDHYREYFTAQVLPYYNKYKKPDRPHHIKTIMAISDTHDKDCCPFTLSTFIETCRIKQPDVIVLNGDIYDLLEFGKYKVDPRHYDIVGRFEFVRERIFRALRNVCPDAQIDLICGNHEIRLLKLLADETPNVRILLSDVMGLSFKDIFGLDEFQINWVSKFDLGAYSNKDMKDEIKKNYCVYYSCFIFAHIPDKRLESLSGSNGHHHSGQIKSYSFVDPRTGLIKQLTWSQTPAGHVADAEYLTHTSGWNTGFLEVVININTHEAIQKVHYTNSDWTMIDGVVYERS